MHLKFLKHYIQDFVSIINQMDFLELSNSIFFGGGGLGEKGEHQGCILSSCLSNLYEEYTVRNAGLEKAQLESRLLGEISITSDMQMTPPLWQKVKRN